MTPHLHTCARGRYLERLPLREVFLAAILRTGPRCDCGAVERLTGAAS